MLPGFGVSAECQSIGTSGKKQRAYYLAPKTIWCLGRVPKHRNHWQEVEGSGKKQRACYLAPKLSVGSYFEHSFLGCGFLIHLSNKSDGPRFRAPWKKIRQKYGTQQELSLFKGHPLTCTIRNFIHALKQELLVHILSFRSQGVVSLFIFPTGPTSLDSEPRGKRYVKNTGHNRNRLYSRAIHCPIQSVISYTLLSRNRWCIF